MPIEREPSSNYYSIPEYQENKKISNENRWSNEFIINDPSFDRGDSIKENFIPRRHDFREENMFYSESKKIENTPEINRERLPEISKESYKREKETGFFENITGRPRSERFIFNSDKPPKPYRPERRYAPPEGYYATEEKSSALHIFAEVLQKRGLGIKITNRGKDGHGRNLEGRINIFVDDKDKIVVDSAFEKPEMKIIRGVLTGWTHYQNISFDGLEVESFKNEKIQAKLRALNVACQIKLIKTRPFAPSSEVGRLEEVLKELLDRGEGLPKLRLPSEEDIKDLVDEIVTHYFPDLAPKYKKDPTRMSARQVADLDPYGVRE